MTAPTMVAKPVPSRRGRHRATIRPQTGLQLLASCRPRSADLLRLVLWTLVEAAPAAISGLSVAHAVDAFRAGHTGSAVLWLAAFGVTVVCGAIATRGLYSALAPAVEETRDQLMAALVRGSIATLATTGRTGSTPLTQLLDQVDQVRNLLSAIARNARTTVAPLIAALVGLFALNPILGIVVVVPVLVALLLYVALLPRMVGAERAAAVADEDLGGKATAILESSATVAGLGAQRWATDTLSTAADAAGRADLRVATLHAWRHLVIAIGGYAPLALVLLIGAPMVRSGEISVGDIAGAATYILTGLLPALSASVTGAGGWFVQLAVLLGRLLPVARTEDPTPVRVPSGPIPGVALSAEQVSFRYRAGARPVVDHLDLSIAAGQMMALVGPSGAGKTTLAHLMTGLLAPTDGAAGAGRDVRSVLVPQTSYVFRGSVRENLTYLAQHRPADRELWSALDAVGLRTSVERWGGLDGSLVDDGAHRPTPSEAQRLVLARSWLSGAQVLVLDEAWSLLDEPDRRWIENWLRASGRTLVVISHHLDVLDRADIVAYFDGRAVHTGTHATLIAASPSYRDLVTRSVHGSAGFGEEHC